MADFKTLISSRRSCRDYSEETIDAESVRLILRAALMSPTSRNRQAWHFVVVDDAMLLEKLSDSKDFGSSFLRKASLAVVVLGDPLGDDCWIEDCSIAAVTMQYQAEDLGIGSCWVQIRGRGLSDGTPSDDVVHGILDVPDSFKVLCVIGFGRMVEGKEMHDEDSLKWENVHINKF